MSRRKDLFLSAQYQVMEKQDSQKKLPKEEKKVETEKAETEGPQQLSFSGIPAAKKSQKVKTGGSGTKPKLPSLHESCKEGDETSHGRHKDDDESATCKLCVIAEDSVLENKSRMSFFGVRSYLHQFYESASGETPGGEEDYHYLIQPKERSCGEIMFKIGLITGSTLFLLGGITILIGYIIPPQQELLGQTHEFKIIDKNALSFNKHLDMCKLIGLAMFCSGGLILVISLLGPTFSSSYWEEDLVSESFRVPLNLSPIPEDEPKSPIPATEKIEGIQPVWTQ